MTPLEAFEYIEMIKRNMPVVEEFNTIDNEFNFLDILDLGE